MLENLTRLYNTLMLVETKGESSKLMVDSIRFLEQMIAAERQQRSEVEGE